MRRLSAVVLLSALLGCGAAACQNAPANPWTDTRLATWSRQMNAGQFDQVIHEVEADLVSPAPHPFSIDIWCRLQLRQKHLDAAAAAITDPALRNALGAAPQIYSLANAGKYAELERLSRSLSPQQIRTTPVYSILIQNADATTDYDHGFDLALRALRTAEPSFNILWDTMLIYEDDLAQETKLRALLASDTAFAQSPPGQVLARTLSTYRTTVRATNCNGRTTGADQVYNDVARYWLSIYPGDSAAQQYQVKSLQRINSNSKDLQVMMDAAFSSYPLLYRGSAVDALLDSYFAAKDDAADQAARDFSLRWYRLYYADPAEQLADSVALDSQQLRSLTGCDKSGRDETAMGWIKDALANTPQPAHAPLLSEQAELDLRDKNDPGAPQRAVSEARQAIALHDTIDRETLLMRALLNTNKDADAAEALRVSKDAYARFADRSIDFYTQTDNALARVGTSQDREANWQRAIQEFPRSYVANGMLSEAENRLGHTAQAIAAVQTYFQIVLPWAGNLPYLEQVWAETDGLDSIDKHRQDLISATPQQFADMSAPLTPVLTTVSPLRPAQLQLTPQIAPAVSVSAMTLSPDGKLAATADRSGMVQIWTVEAPVLHGNGTDQVCVSLADSTCPRILQTFLAHTGHVDSMEFSGDDQWLVTASQEDGKARVWRVATGQMAFSLDTKPGVAPYIALQPSAPGRPDLLAVLVRQPDPARNGVAQEAGWSTLTVCAIPRNDACSSLHWYSSGAGFLRDERNALRWSGDGAHLLMRAAQQDWLLWDWKTRRLIRRFELKGNPVFRPDLSAAIYVDDGSLKYQKLDGESQPVTLVTWQGQHPLLDKQFLADGRIRYAWVNSAPQPAAGNGQSAQASSAGSTIDLMELSSPAPGPGKLIGRLPAAQFPAPLLHFAAQDDRFAVVSMEAFQANAGLSVPTAIGYLEPRPEPLMQALSSHQQLSPFSLAFTANAHRLIAGVSSGAQSTQARLDIWDLAQTGRPLTPGGANVSGAQTIVDGSQIVTCAQQASGIGRLFRYNLDGRAADKGEPVECDPQSPLAALAGGGMAWITDTAHVLPASAAPWSSAMVDASGEKVLHVNALAGTPTMLLAATDTDVFRITKDQTASICTDACPSSSVFPALDLSADGHYAVIAVGGSRHSTPPQSADFGVLVADLHASPVALRMQKDSSGPLHVAVTSVVFLPGSSRYVAGTVDGRLFLADAVQDGMREILHQGSPVDAIGISPDGRFLAAGLDSGLILLCTISADANIQEVASLARFNDGDWAVVSPQSGQYDAAHAGRLDELYWSYGTSVIQLEQMLSSYYRAGLLPKLAGFETTPLEKSPPLDAFNPSLATDVRIVSIDPATEKIVVAPKVPNKRIDNLRLYVNNVSVSTAGSTTRPDGSIEVPLAGQKALRPGQLNDVTARDGSTAQKPISSPDAKASYVAPGAAQTAPQQFYAVITGISQYGAGLDSLPSADADARAMAQAVARGARHLVGSPARVHIYLLSSDPQQGPQTADQLKREGLANVTWESPTRANLDAVLKALPDAGMTNNDIFLLFLAGHGGTVAGTQFAYLTQDFSQQSPSADFYLTSTDLNSDLRPLVAKHKVLIFDTCDSGQFIKDLYDLQRQDLANANHDEFSDSAYLLMGSESESFGSNSLGHGFLTAGLFNSMREKLNGENLQAADWLYGAGRDTQKIAQRYGQTQFPPEVQPGDVLKVAVIPAPEVECIPDLNAVPLLQQPDINDADFNDPKGLKAALNQELANRSDDTTKLPSFVYLTGNSPVPHIIVRGTYTVTADRLSVKLIFRYGENGQLSGADKLIEIPAGSNQLQAAVSQIADAIDSYALFVEKQKQKIAMPPVCTQTLATSAP